MVGPEIEGRHGSFYKAYDHYGRQLPSDLADALEQVTAALEGVRNARGTDQELERLGALAVHVAGLRERLEAATVHVATELRDGGMTVSNIARLMGAHRPTINGWLSGDGRDRG